MMLNEKSGKLEILSFLFENGYTLGMTMDEMENAYTVEELWSLVQDCLGQGEDW